MPNEHDVVEQVPTDGAAAVICSPALGLKVSLALLASPRPRLATVIWALLDWPRHWLDDIAMTAAIRKFMNENKSAFDPRDYLKPAREAAKKICKTRYEQFGCAGMASKIKPLPLDAVASKYKSGELAQVVR